MKTPLLSSLSLILTLTAAPAFAYGPHFSNGTGFSCDLIVSADAVAQTACPAHIQSVKTTQEPFRDINGNRILNSIRQIDSLACVNTFTMSNAQVVASTNQDSSSELKFAVGKASSNAMAVYKNTDGTVDVENSPNTRHYIEYEVAANAAAQEADRFQAITAQLADGIEANYSAAEKQLELIVPGIAGGFRTQVSANFSEGTKVTSTEVELPLNLELLNGRTVKAKVRCVANF